MNNDALTLLKSRLQVELDHQEGYRERLIELETEMKQYTAWLAGSIDRAGSYARAIEVLEEETF